MCNIILLFICFFRPHCFLFFNWIGKFRFTFFHISCSFYRMDSTSCPFKIRVMFLIKGFLSPSFTNFVGNKCFRSLFLHKQLYNALKGLRRKHKIVVIMCSIILLFICFFRPYYFLFHLVWQISFHILSQKLQILQNGLNNYTP